MELCCSGRFWNKYNAIESACQRQSARYSGA
jgi:hypothetical protein